MKSSLNRASPLAPFRFAVSLPPTPSQPRNFELVRRNINMAAAAAAAAAKGKAKARSDQLAFSDTKTEKFPWGGGMSRLMTASRDGNAAKVVKLIDEESATVDLANKHGQTALHFASTAAVVNALLDRGADLHSKTSVGPCSYHSQLQPFHSACMFKNAESMQAMIARGADPNVRTGGLIPATARRWSRTPGTEALLTQHGVSQARW